LRSVLPGLLSLLLVIPVGAMPPAAKAREVRGLWVVRTGLLSPETVDQVVDRARAGGFNTLLVQVRGRGDAFYSSKIVERSPLLAHQAAGFDPFARLLERASAAGIEVHAWINVLLASHFPSPSRENVVVRHPAWVMVPRSVARRTAPTDANILLAQIRQASRTDTDVEGFYISPSSLEVQEHLEAVVREIVRQYPVRGLHLDFIRYPNPDYDWSLVALEGFRRQQGSGDPIGLPVARPEAWEQYRRSVLTSLAERLSSAARSERPGLIISAAVVPDEAAAIHHRYQDWPTWLSRGILDALCPMTYTPDTRIFREQVEGATARAKAGQSIWAGVGAYRLTVDDVFEKIGAARHAGASGVVLFSNESLSAAALKRLSTEVFTP
jgi:uncharacterized lipoprotein YddW (UPF0748 family)